MQYRATFSPQAWVNDYAISVDPEGDTTWDVTEFFESLTPAQQQAILSNDGRDYDDLLWQDPNAPEWVREWRGPFDTRIEPVE